MSLFGMMRTSVSGMSAQATRLSAVGDNIANANTTGYKKAEVEFATLTLPQVGGKYISGGVDSDVRYGITQQGTSNYTSNNTDLLISGNGFFLVEDAGGQVSMTRAGSFRLNGDGELVNAAGMRLLGYSGGATGAVVNGTAGLEPINISALSLQATPSTSGVLSLNFPADAPLVAPADRPSLNAATAAPAAQTSVLAYDNLGREVVLDIYMSQVATGDWEVAVFDQSQASPTGFPYAAGPLVTQNFQFDPANGQLAGASATNISVPVPGGATLVLDLANSSQLAANYTVLDVDIDGNGASAVTSLDVGEDGQVFAVYEDGTRRASYLIPLATVASPDKLTPRAGNVYLPSADSGDMRIGNANQAGLGKIVSGALENSTVDIADELTTMIQAQRSFTANSKVFQTGSELMDVLVNLKR